MISCKAGLTEIVFYGVSMEKDRCRELYHSLLGKGIPEDLCREIAYKRMNTDYTATRMLGYLYRHSEPRIEDVVDEMLAILSDRDSLIKKHEMEHVQAELNEMYRHGLEADEMTDSAQTE